MALQELITAARVYVRGSYGPDFIVDVEHEFSATGLNPADAEHAVRELWSLGWRTGAPAIQSGISDSAITRHGPVPVDSLPDYARVYDSRVAGAQRNTLGITRMLGGNASPIGQSPRG